MRLVRRQSLLQSFAKIDFSWHGISNEYESEGKEVMKKIVILVLTAGSLLSGIAQANLPTGAPKIAEGDKVVLESTKEEMQVMGIIPDYYGKGKDLYQIAKLDQLDEPESWHWVAKDEKVSKK